MKAPVGTLFFIDSEGNLDKEAVEEAKKRSEQQYTESCLVAAMGALNADNLEVARAVSIRHYYSTRHVLELTEMWVRGTIAKHPEVKDMAADDLLWAIKCVLEGADDDLASATLRRSLDKEEG